MAGKLEFLNPKDPTVDKNAVKKALTEGAEIEGARLESSISMTIK